MTFIKENIPVWSYLMMLLTFKTLRLQPQIFRYYTGGTGQQDSPGFRWCQSFALLSHSCLQAFHGNFG